MHITGGGYGTCEIGERKRISGIPWRYDRRHRIESESQQLWIPWEIILQSVGSHWKILREMTSHFSFRVWVLAGDLVWSRDQPGSSCSLKPGDEMGHHENFIQVTKKKRWRWGGNLSYVLEAEMITFGGLLDGQRWMNWWTDSGMFNLGSIVTNDAIDEIGNLGYMVGCIMTGKDKLFIWSKSTCGTHFLPFFHSSFQTFLLLSFASKSLQHSL